MPNFLHQLNNLANDNVCDQIIENKNKMNRIEDKLNISITKKQTQTTLVQYLYATCFHQSHLIDID